MKTPLFLLALFLLLGGCKSEGAAPASVASPIPSPVPVACKLYVSPAGSDMNAGTEALPFKTIGQASRSLTSGGMVCVADGVYPESMLVRASGTAASWVVFKSTHPYGAKITGVAGNPNPTVAINERSYVEINGFDITAPPGGNQFCVYTGYLSGGHHTRVIGNKVHDCGGSGIQMSAGDYRWIEGNTVYRNAFNNPNSGSGISVYHPVLAGTDAPGVPHVLIRGNVVYENDNHFAGATDGNGIILDDYQHTQDSGVPFTGDTLVDGNVVTQNGRGGIHAYHSDRVTVRGNTVLLNQRRAVSGELSNVLSSNNNWLGNTVLSNRKAILSGGGANVTWDNSIREWAE